MADEKKKKPDADRGGTMKIGTGVLYEDEAYGLDRALDGKDDERYSEGFDERLLQRVKGQLKEKPAPKK